MGTSSLAFQALFLGILQGLTEFLPVSSSAHLILVPWFFQWNHPLMDSLTFDVALHTGTLLAILLFFFKDWVKLIRALFSLLTKPRLENFQERLVLYILLSTIPAVVAGFLLQDAIAENFRNPVFIVIPLISVSLFMIYAEKRKKHFFPLEKLTFQNSLIIGFSQALALLPGVSRSGITISTGLLRGYDRRAATHFSFLLSTPAIAGAAFLQLRHLSWEIVTGSPIFIVGFLSSGLIGYLSIAFLMRFLRRHSLHIFAGYRLALSAAVILWIFWRR